MVYIRGRPKFGYGFGYGSETASKMTFGPVSVSANIVSVKFPLRPNLEPGFDMSPKSTQQTNLFSVKQLGASESRTL